MQNSSIPLTGKIPKEVPLANSPLVRVISQVRFPPILSIQKENSVSDFQEALRGTYPFLRKDRSTDITLGKSPNITEAIIWRLSDSDESAANWQVSLGVDFIALETTTYKSRADFIGRIQTVLDSAEECFRPAAVKRIGLRYVDQLEGQALEQIGNLVQSGVLGILQPDVVELDDLRKAVVTQMTQVKWIAEEGSISGRWGNLAKNMTYAPDVVKAINQPSWVLDLDMFTTKPLPFESKKISTITEAFSKRIYAVFRQMVTDEFLEYYGGTP